VRTPIAQPWFAGSAIMGIKMWVKCPMCGLSFDPRGRGLVCPGCGEELTWDHETALDLVLFEVSLVGIPVVLYLAGVHSLIAFIGCPALFYIVGMSISSWLLPRQIVLKRSDLRLRK